MNIVIILFTGLIGLCLGSFMHVVICRFSPQKTSWQFLYNISFKHSCCTHCMTKLSFLSLLPMISWLVQRGKCPHCSSTIAIHYLLTELAISIFCIGIIVIYGVCTWSIMLILLGVSFITLAVIDMQFLLLPNCFTYTILFSGLITAYADLGKITLLDSLLGCVLGYLLLWLPATAYYLLKKHPGLGGGDIKLLAALGTWIDYTQLPILLTIASLIGLCYFLITYHLQPALRKKPIVIPFGPGLLIAGYILLMTYP